MPITWQTRGEGRFAHRFHALSAAQASAIPTPTAEGVQVVDVDGAAAYGLALPTPSRWGRPLLWGPVVYPDAATAEGHAEAWLVRDRDAYYAALEHGES